MDQFKGFLKLIWDTALIFFGIVVSIGWIVAAIFFALFEDYGNIVPSTLTILSLILIYVYVVYRDEQSYKKILERSKEHNGIPLSDFCKLVYSRYFNQKDYFVKFFPKLHITWKLLAEAEGLNKNNFNTYNPNNDSSIFKIIDNKPYLSQNKIKKKKDLDLIIKENQYTTPVHLMDNLHIILRGFNDDEVAIRKFLSDEENRKTIISSRDCRRFLAEKIVSIDNKLEIKIYQLLIDTIHNHEYICVKKMYKDFGYNYNRKKT